MEPTNDPDSLRARLRALRECAGLSARELSRLAGLRSPGHVSLIESGEIRLVRGMEPATVRGLCRVLGCDAAHLQTGEGDAPTLAEIMAAVTRARARHRKLARAAERTLSRGA